MVRKWGGRGHVTYGAIGLNLMLFTTFIGSIPVGRPNEAERPKLAIYESRENES